MAEKVERLREHHIHLILSRASEEMDAFWIAEAYDQAGGFLGIAVQPTRDDVWLTIADEVLPLD